ncbi:MAG TPA: fatty acid--CoA ligase family protein [Verrucomicrobiae bacterium]|nr:fatty acid--CoA ligase family protein [Verrucomicrobiae bacterium]
MLYDRWREISRAESEKIALRDLASDRQWTFRELAQAAEQGSFSSGKFSFPQGISPEFIFDVLRAWKNGQVVCPLEHGQLPPEIAPGLPPEIVHLKMTSATTGAARMIAFTASQLIADAENIVATMGLRADWPNIGIISLAHSYGFSNLVLPLLLHGIPLILASAPLPELLKRAAASEKSVTLAAVPALWRTWHEANSIPANVRLAISAGAPLPIILEKEIFKTRGLKIHNFYGSSECGGIAYDASLTPRLDGACAGAPMRNVQLSVARNGCLEIQSKAVAQTYWPEPDANLRDGIFRTSDLAEILDGIVFLRGRASDQINVAGRKVSPESIEKILLAHPRVRECLVFGAPSEDSNRGEMIVACVVGKTNLATEELKQFLLAKLPAWQVPREWLLIESLAVNGRGKLSRAEWRKRFVNRRER